MAMTWWNCPEVMHRDALICDGSVRSGKTLSMAVGFFLWSMCRFENQVFGICGKTVASLRRNVILHLTDWLDGLVQITEYRAENKLVATLGGRVNTYYLFGGQDESSYSLIQGITLAGVLLDEAALMPRSFVEQACARCSVADSKMWFNCNPSHPEHWFYKEWILGAAKKNALHLHFTMADNPALAPKVRQRYESMFSGVFYRRYVLGQWCAAQGLVYDFDKNRHVCPMPEPGGRYYISVDYGTRNPFSAGLWQVLEGRAVRLREFYYDGRATGRSMTDEEYADALESLAGDIPVEAVVIDPSAASLIALLRRRRRFRVRKAKNAVLPGIQAVAGLLRQGRLGFCPCCLDSIREFGLYRWQEDRDEPVKENDHAMDEIRYFVMTVLKAM